MEYFVQQLINGLTLGAIYGLIAIGYTMVYGIIGMINFAHGEVYMIGASVSFNAFLILGLAGITWLPVALLIVLVLAMLFTSVYGWTLERLAYRPLRGSPRLAALISAIGASIFLQNYVQLTQVASPKPLQPMITGGFIIMDDPSFPVRLSYLQILLVFMTIGLLAIFSYMIAKTPLGRAQRACEQDRTMAALIGINVDRTISTSFVIGAALASVAGMMVTLYYGVIDFYIGFLAGVKAFTAAVLGGIGSLPGAVIGLAFDLGLIMIGFVLPWRVVVGTAIGSVLGQVVLNPILQANGLLPLWQPGRNALFTQFHNGLDFWLSVSIGMALFVVIIGF